MFGRPLILPNQVSNEDLTRLFDSKEEASKTFVAMSLLNLTLGKFTKIHTRELKCSYLRYLYLRKELETVADKVARRITAKECKETCEVLEKAVIIVRTSTQFDNLIANHVNTYGTHSRGIMELDTRSPYETSRKEEVNPMLASFVPMKQKESGVEPGFEGFQIEDVLRIIYIDYPNFDIRVAFLERHGANIRTLQEAVKTKLPRYMIKLTNEVEDNNSIVPRKEDAERTNAIKRIVEMNAFLGAIAVKAYQFSKTCTPTEKNIEAISEVLANDIARLFMKVQDQKIYPGESKQGIFQVLLKGEWIENATTLKTVGWDNRRPNNYRARATILPHAKIKYISDNSIKNMSAILPLLIVQSDRDAVGSNGQNKLVKDNELWGIDFGHAYPEKAVKYSQYAKDFHVEDDNFKNYSIFYDVPRSEIMRGVFKLARLGGMRLDDNVLKSYGDDLYAEVMQLGPQMDEEIFDDYLYKMAELFKGFDYYDASGRQNQECCTAVMRHISTIKERHVTARNGLIANCSQYLMLDRNTIDFIENLEKFIAASRSETSLRSDNGEIILNHIRVLKNFVVNMNIEKSEQRYKFIMHFSNDENAKLAYDALDRWIGRKIYGGAPLTRIADEVHLVIHPGYLKDLTALFHEDKIKEKFHAADFKYYLAEIELANVRRAMDSCGVKTNITVDKYSQLYQIRITPLQEKFDPIFINILSSKVQINIRPQVITFDIEPSHLGVMGPALQYIPKLYQRRVRIEKEIAEALDDFTNAQSKLLTAADYSTPLIVLTRLPGEDTFNLRLKTPINNAILSDLLNELYAGSIDHVGLPALVSHIVELTKRYQQLAESANKQFSLYLQSNATYLIRDPSRPFHYFVDLSRSFNIPSLFTFPRNAEGFYLITYKDLNAVINKIQERLFVYNSRERERSDEAWKNQMVTKQLAMFNRIIENFRLHYCVGDKLKTNIGFDNKFTVHINAELCDPILQKELSKAALVYFKKIANNMWSLDINEMLTFNEKLLDAYGAYVKHCETMKSTIFDHHTRLKETIHKIMDVLKLTNTSANLFTSSLQLVKSNYAKLFSNDLTAVNFIKTLEDYLFVADILKNDIQALAKNLVARRDHILRANNPNTILENHLLHEAIQQCDTLCSFKDYELNYLRLFPIANTADKNLKV